MLLMSALFQYVLVKFLEPRQADAQRLGIMSVKFAGLKQKALHTRLTGDEVRNRWPNALFC